MSDALLALRDLAALAPTLVTTYDGDDAVVRVTHPSGMSVMIGEGMLTPLTEWTAFGCLWAHAVTRKFSPRVTEYPRAITVDLAVNNRLRESDGPSPLVALARALKQALEAQG